MDDAFANRCAVCKTALAGPESVLPRVFGIHRSRHNPNICTRCKAHIGDKQLVEVSIVFADLSQFTVLTQTLGPERAAEIVQAFLKMATESLIKHDALIDKYIGDSVMAIFNIPIMRPDHTRLAAASALDIQASMAKLRQRFGLDLRAKVAVASGVAQIGEMGSHGFADYTAIGDAVNLASRLEGEARAGEILLHGRVYDQAASDISAEVAEEMLTLKGFNEPVRAYRLVADVDGQPPARQLNPEYRAKGQPATQRAFGFGSTVFSILAAPCAAGAALGPAAILIGAGSLFAQFQSTLLAPLDLPLVRLPMQTIAVIGTAANLYALWRSSRVRRKARAAGSKASLTLDERRRVALVIGLAALTAFSVIAELYAHVFLNSMPVM